MKVLMMPDYRAGNPYQQLLADALSELGVSVHFPIGYRRVFPLWREVKSQTGSEPRILHLHWLTPYLKGRNALVFALYGLKVLIDLLLVRIAGWRIVWTIHNRVSHESVWPQAERWISFVVAALADRLILHTPSAAVEIGRDFGVQPSKMKIIPHGHYRTAYPSPPARKECRGRLGLPPAGPIFLFFGGVRPYKGIEQLLSTWKKLAAKDDNAQLVIAGQPLNAEYESTIRSSAQLLPRLTLMLHRIPDNDLPLYFGCADAVVLPFERVFTSGSLVLALSYDKPVICPGLDFIRDFGNSTSLRVYDSETPESLLSSMKEFLSEVSMLGEELSVNHIQTLPDWESVASLTFESYSD